MKALDVMGSLVERGYTVTEAWQVLHYLAEERALPSSQPAQRRLRQAEETLRAVGIDPETVTFDDWPHV